MSAVFWTRSGRNLAGMAAVCMMASGCATTGTTSSGMSTETAPPNYKQVIAAEIRTWEDASAIQSGEISSPYVRWMGLAYGGMRPAVCVMLIKPLTFGNIGPAFYMFYFDNGKPDYITLGATAFSSRIGCPDQVKMMPFTEVSSRT
jgi:hypothetical protein